MSVDIPTTIPMASLNTDSYNINNDNSQAPPPMITEQVTTTYIRTDEEIQDALNQLDELYFFFKTAPVQWNPHQLMRRYHLNNDLGFIT